jgi:integrase
MATITSYTKKDGSKAWQFQTYLGIDELTRKKRFTTRRGFKTKKEAQSTLNKLLVEIEEQGFHDTNVTTFEQLYNQWIDLYETTVKPSTFAYTLYVYNKYILPKFGKLELNRITVSYCQKVLNGWYKQFKCYRAFKGKANILFNYGVSIEVLNDNPMAKTQTPRAKESTKGVNFYTKDELLNFLDLYKKDCDEKTSMIFRLLAFTGMRKSEVIALQWSDIDFFRQQLTIGKTIAVTANSSLIIQTPKTKGSYRTINIDRATLKMLNDWQNTQRKYFLKLGINVNNSSQFVFTNKRNNYVRPSYINECLNKFYARHLELSKITVHGFRHTHCSLLFEAGASMKEVQERLGHNDIQTTMNIYAHVTPETVKDTGDKFAKFMEL